MLHRIGFIKVSGAGNDFLLVDNLESSYKIDWAPFARTVCSRPFGVGADGLLLLESSDRADFRMRYYNADGSTGAMCGNGGRCAARYSFSSGLTGPRVTFEVNQSLYEATVEHDLVRMNMPDINGLGTTAQVELTGSGSIPALLIDTGAPHIVVKARDIEKLDVEGLGRQLRYHPLVMPAGANADFYTLGGRNEVSVRTYERGVERETQSCGTGVVASALSAALSGEAESPVQVTVKSGETLSVGFQRTDRGFRELTLTGSAHFLFSGDFLYDEGRGAIRPETLQGVRAAG